MDFISKSLIFFAGMPPTTIFSSKIELPTQAFAATAILFAKVISP